jgi:hypothetical protein
MVENRVHNTEVPCPTCGAEAVAESTSTYTEESGWSAARVTISCSNESCPNYL